MKKLVGVTALLIVSMSNLAGAADTTAVYAGVDLGLTHFTGDHWADGQTFAPRQHFIGNDSGAGLHVGYQLVDWFAVELGYTDFGSDSHRFKLNTDVMYIVAPNDTQHLSAKGTSLSGVFNRHLSQSVSLFGVVGVSTVGYRTRWSGGFSEASGGPVPVQRSYRDQSLIVGAGVRYAISDQWNLRMDVRRNDLRDFNMDTLSVGAEYRF